MPDLYDLFRDVVIATGVCRDVMDFEHGAFAEDNPKLHGLIHQFNADVCRLADDRERLLAENAAFRQREMDHENAEASVCPEDVGFVEYIGSLKSALDKAQRERDEAQQQNAHYRRMLALDVVTDPLSSRASLPSPETKL